MNNICRQCTCTIEIVFYRILVVHICAKVKQHCDLFNTSFLTCFNQGNVDITSLQEYRECTLIIMPLWSVSPSIKDSDKIGTEWYHTCICKIIPKSSSNFPHCEEYATHPYVHVVVSYMHASCIPGYTKLFQKLIKLSVL